MTTNATAHEARRLALAGLFILSGDQDTENAHAQADGIMASFVRALGYPEVADAYHRVEKRYA